VPDQERSAKFYVDLLGGKVVKAKDPCYTKLSNERFHEFNR
jgi:catechol 2,3-dioxygenase-like lactoylglutathione lyase family enzyme